MIAPKILPLFFLMLPLVCRAQYKVEGRLGDESGKWGTIYLEYIPSIENLTHLMVENVVGTSQLDSMGSFLIEGMGLPQGKHLYRLFLMKKSEENGSYGITNGSIRNFNIVVLDNNSHVNVQCGDVSDSFANCIFLNNPESEAISQLYDQITAPILMELARDSILPPSEMKAEFLFKQMSDLLLNFADTTNYALPGILALQLLPDFEKTFTEQPAFFSRFAKKASGLDAKSPYVMEFNAKILALDTRHFGKGQDWTRPLLYFFIGLSVFLLLFVFRLKTKLKRYEAVHPQSTVPDRAVLETLSPKELEVLQLMAGGKSNKEIAGALFIETSTVKSHINKIYQKLSISTRQEARRWLDTLTKI